MQDDETREALLALLGPRLGRKLGRMGWGQIEAVALDPEHKLQAELLPEEMGKIKALVKVCHRYYPEQCFSPKRITCTADVVRLLGPRCETARERMIWLLALEADGRLIQEVLIQLGGDRSAPPAVRSLLRHALLRDAAAMVVADFRLEEGIAIDWATEETFGVLRRLGLEAGLAVRDYVVLAQEGARSLAGWHSKPALAVVA